MIIRLLLIITLFFSSTVLYASNPPSLYLPGGAEYMPDAEYGISFCHNPDFYCRRVHEGDTWELLFPKKSEREFVMRLNRTSVPLRYRSFVIIPKNKTDRDFAHYTSFPEHRDTHHKRLLAINLEKFDFAAYDKSGALIFSGPVSGGKVWCDDTKESCATAMGDYHVFKIKDDKCTSGTYPLTTKGGAPMPYCMYYYKGFAIHGSTLSGFINRSRGCVRLFDADAKWLNEHFVKLGTEVTVN